MFKKNEIEDFSNLLISISDSNGLIIPVTSINYGNRLNPIITWECDISKQDNRNYKVVISGVKYLDNIDRIIEYDILLFSGN